MNIFSSGWMQRMVDKAGTTPASRIHALFLILQDWIEVPGLRQQLQDVPLDEENQLALKACLLQLVLASRVTHPDRVAGQVYMLLLGALNEELRQPGSQALEHGGRAALLLVNAQMPARRALAASVALMTGLLVLLAVWQRPEPVAVHQQLAVAAAPRLASPDRLATFYHLHDQIHAANCSYPQALMLAPEQRTLFMESVVNGDVGGIAPESMVMVGQLYQKVDCYYPPAAMLL